MTNKLQIAAKNYIVTTIQTLLKIKLTANLHLLLFKKYFMEMKATKRNYHLLVQFFLCRILSLEQLGIPKTTIDYWRKNNHVDLFGYAW
jgi:hypothetical protein